MRFRVFVEMVKAEAEKLAGNAYDIGTQELLKNNGRVCVGLVMTRKGEKGAPVMYLEPYYERAEAGELSAEDVARELLAAIAGLEKRAFSDVELDEFERVKGRIIYRLIDYKRNEDLLEDVPFLPYEDLAVVFCVFIRKDEKGLMSALIHTGHVNGWKTDVATLYRLADKNTPRLFPPVVKSMEEIIREVSGSWPQEEKDGAWPEIVSETASVSRQYVLTNQMAVYGATAILYEGVLKQIARALGSDLIILPSSVHEVILVPYDDRMEPEELGRMVREINMTEVSEEDVLSDQVYVYRREAGRVLNALTEKTRKVS